jgi:GNAT superfamily N-acetyltransferase
MSVVSVRPAVAADRAAILELAERLAAFGPLTRTAAEITARERRALADALEQHSSGSSLLVASDAQLRVIGILLLETRRDYFTDEAHGHVAILAVAREAEGKGVGRALLDAAEAWGRRNGFQRLTLAVFTENQSAKAFYARQGWRPELETHYRILAES